jgi:hypothetical protein
MSWWATSQFVHLIQSIPVKTMEKSSAFNNFGAVVYALKRGGIAWRASWDKDKGEFIFRQVPSEVPEAIIPKMTSLPPAVKEILVSRQTPARYSNQWAQVSGNNDIRAYTPTVADVEAEDWVIEGFEVEPAAEPIVAGDTVGTAKPLE